MLRKTDLGDVGEEHVAHPKAPYLRLVVNQDHPISAFGTGDLLHKMFEAFSRLRGVANTQVISRTS
jgi:hypothetical protein